MGDTGRVGVFEGSSLFQVIVNVAVRSSRVLSRSSLASSSSAEHLQRDFGHLFDRESLSFSELSLLGNDSSATILIEKWKGYFIRNCITTTIFST